MTTEIFGRGPLAAPVEIWIEQGQSIAEIARNLKAQGVIRDPFVFSAIAFVLRSHPRAGEFKIPAEISPYELLIALRDMKPILRKLSIAEGLTNAEIFALIESSPYLTGALPDLPPIEGLYLPETYFFERGLDRSRFLQRAMKAMTEKLESLWQNRDPDIPLTNVSEALILASIVEKETGVAQERPHIASVFYNRLKRGMKLQTDPTVIYALTMGKEKLGRALTRADLDTPSPYNTYYVAGLPPGAIANPGEAALLAVMHPMKTGDLYFVADGEGGHLFAETFEQHKRNVAKWRRAQDAAPK